MTAATLNAAQGFHDFTGAHLHHTSVRQAPAYVENIAFAGAGAATLALPATGPGSSNADVVFLKAIGGNLYVKAYTGSPPAFSGATTADGSGFEVIPQGETMAYRLGPIAKTALAGLQLYLDAAGMVSASFYAGGQVA